MPRGAGLLTVLLLAGCLDAHSSRCSDGRVCAPGTSCVVGLDQCVTSEQLAACSREADGSRCVTAAIAIGICAHGACISSGCGNGVTEPGEACDDGNQVSGDGCSADCKSTEVCGNGIADRGEQCDCGTGAMHNPACPGPNSDSSGPCSSGCRLRCGDGVVAADEGCDPGASSVVSCAGAMYDRGLTTCSPSCQPNLSAESCRYIGFRTRVAQSATPVRRIAATTASDGYYVESNQANTYHSYTMAGTAFNSTAPMRAVWAAGASFAIAVGDQGVAAHWSGTVWTQVATGTTADLIDVWGRASDDVFALAASSLIHWNGTSWSPLSIPAGSYHALAGDEGHLYVVGDAGTVRVFDGAQWATEDPGTTANLVSVWAAGGRVVAVGDAGTIVERDVSGWTPGKTRATANLASVWGSASDGFFAVGEHGTVLFGDGRVWRPLSLGRGVVGSPGQDFTFVTGLPGVTVGLVGAEDVVSYEGAAWSPTAMPTSDTLYALWGTASDDVFAVGRNGAILHHDGLTWTAQPSPTTADLHSVWGRASDDVYATGDAMTLLHYDGTAWSIVAGGAAGRLDAVWVADAVYAAGASGIYRYDGATFTQVSLIGARALWGTSATSIYAAGARIVHYDGSGWGQMLGSADVAALSGTSDSDVWAVGSGAEHYDGTAWSRGPFTDSDLAAVCVAPALGAFAAGKQGTLRHWDGTAVEPFISRRTTDLDGLFISGNVLFVAGIDGALDTLVFHR